MDKYIHIFEQRCTDLQMDQSVCVCLAHIGLEDVVAPGSKQTKVAVWIETRARVRACK